MKAIARSRGTGKTKELLLAAQQEGGMVLTGNKRGLQEKARAYGIEGVTIVDWDDIIYRDEELNSKPIFVHNLDDIMESYFWDDFGLKLRGYSLTLED
mgnify:CR=1 FL=1